MGGISIKRVKVINLNPFLMSILKKMNFTWIWEELSNHTTRI